MNKILSNFANYHTQTKINMTCDEKIQHNATTVYYLCGENFNDVKKITHMWRRWGTLQNFFFAFIDELEKQIIITKTVEVGQ